MGVYFFIFLRTRKNIDTYMYTNVLYDVYKA
jgi:hypothetical protein